MSAHVRALGDVQVFDLRAESHELASREWQPRLRRDPAKISGVVIHSWGARVGTTGANRLRYGEPGALARRALGTPYTICCGVTEHGSVPVVALAHPLERYTNASDAGNRHWISIAVMGLFAFDADDTNPVRHTEATAALRAAVDVALSAALGMLAEAGVDPEALFVDGRPLALITHRQCANGARDHFACPGEMVVKMALASEAVRAGLLVPDPDRVLLPEYGKPWPEAWRRHLREQRPLRGVYDLHGALAGDVRPSPSVALAGPEVPADEAAPVLGG